VNEKKYKTLVIDPPWSEVGGGKIKRGAQKHYSVMKTPAIIATIQQSEPFKHINDDAHLYLWVTNSFLQDGLRVMKELGFTYKTNWVWIKDRFGLGQYHRGQHELVLFGIRGKGYNVKTYSKSIPSVVSAKRRAHSQKPEEFYDMVENRSVGPYIDMFHRGVARNVQWDIWGHEAIQENEQAESKNNS
jgi:N6-adenosine-specific RNA methylase IME4